MPKVIDEIIIEALVERGATVSEVALAVRGLRKELADYADRIDKEAEKGAATVKTRRDRYNQMVQRLAAKPLLAGRLKEQAAEALNDLLTAENAVQRHRTLQRFVRLTVEALSGVEAEVMLVHREMVRAGGPQGPVPRGQGDRNRPVNDDDLDHQAR